jgi:hypothetical protein
VLYRSASRPAVGKLGDLERLIDDAVNDLAMSSDEWDLDAMATPEYVPAAWVATLNVTSSRDGAEFDLDWDA